MKVRRRTFATSLVVTTALMVAACGGDDESTTTQAPATQAPDVTDAPAATDAPDATAAPGATEAPDASAAPAEDLEPIKVGLLFSLTGPAGAFGISERDGSRVVLEAVNAAGGVNGRMIEIYEKDDATDPTQATRAARELIENDGVDVIIGATIGGNTLALAPVAAEAEVPILATNGTISVTSKDNDFWPWIFRAAPSDLVAVEALYELMIADGVTSVGVFAQEDAYGTDSLEFLEDLVAERGGLEIVEVARAPLTATDLTPQATRLRNAEPDAVLMIVSPPALGASLTRALRQVGFEGTLFGSQGLSQQSYVEASGEAGEGVRTVAMTHWDDPSEGEAELKAMLEAAGVEPVFAYEIAGSNGAQAIIAALELVDTAEIDGPTMRAALEQLCPFDTFAIGTDVCYTAEDRDGYRSDALVPLVIEGGKFVRFG